MLESSKPYITQLSVNDPMTNHSLPLGVFSTPYQAIIEAKRINALDHEYQYFHFTYVQLDTQLWDKTWTDYDTEYFQIDNKQIRKPLHIRHRNFNFDDMLIELTSNSHDHDKVIIEMAKQARITDRPEAIQLFNDLAVTYTYDDKNDALITGVNDFKINPVKAHIQEIQEQLRHD